jgi:signal transduction histidine kinase
MWQTITSGTVWRGDFINVKKNGETYYEDAVIAPVLDINNEITHFIALKEDVTRRRELEQLKEDVDRMMRHDLKTPLNLIISLPQILKTSEGIDAEALGYLDQIEAAGYAMLKQIHISLDLYKMETGTYSYNPSELDVMEVLDQVMRGTCEKWEECEVFFEIKHQGIQVPLKQPLIMYGESHLFYSMLSNLIVNAIEASPRGGSVGIDIFSDPEYIISIRNDGAVPESIRETFFEKYVTSGKKEGTGLGTYSAKLMAETMGGSISMETSAEKGTIVTVRLPRP